MEKANLYRNKVTYLWPTEDTALLNFELLFHFRILNLPKILIRKNAVNNFDVFSSKELNQSEEGKAGYLGWSGNQS